jgi:integrase
MVEGETQPCCHSCGSNSLFRDGNRYLSDGSSVQRWLCRACGFRFSVRPSKENSEWSLNKATTLLYNHQICALEAKNLEPQTEIKTVAGGKQLSPEQQTRKALIINFMLYMRKQAYRPATITNRAQLLATLINEGANLSDPEDVKFLIAEKQCSLGYKKNLVLAYDTYLRWQGIKWDAPKYKPDPKLPFIPLESEIDQVVNSAGRRTSAFLAVLKETGADPGEALAIEWIDIDRTKKTIIINHPVKGHKPRIINVPATLIDQLDIMPKVSDKVFNVKLHTLHKSYDMQRKTAARKFNNIRLKRINFTTFRHWKATMEYHKTKDILWVMRLLGHNSLKTTLIYIDLEIALFKEINDGFHVKVATTVEEACQLIEVGFEYVCEMYDKKIFRKRK